MLDPLTIHRFHFAFTVTYHYIFPQLTMGLGLLIFILKTMALRGDPVANQAVRFWAKIFGVTFVMGVITGIPLEFQFGTNWSRFSEAAGGVIGQTLAMEGVFAFFLESSFLYLLLSGERRLGQRGHWVAALLVFVGSWLSGFFIVCTNAWMQHPVGYTITQDNVIELASLSPVLTNPWAFVQYAHVMVGTTITASFVMASIGAFYLLRGEHVIAARRFLSVAVVVGAVAGVLAAHPAADPLLSAMRAQQAAAVTTALSAGGLSATDVVVDWVESEALRHLRWSRLRALRRTVGRKVLIVGLDGADWRLIDPLLDAGGLPALARLLGRGVRARASNR